MPSSKSAEKRLRNSMHRRVINRMRKSRIKTAEKHLTEQIETDNSEGAKAALSKCFSEYDQAAKKGTVHKSKANRRKQRLAISVAKMG